MLYYYTSAFLMGITALNLFKQLPTEHAEIVALSVSVISLITGHYLKRKTDNPLLWLTPRLLATLLLGFSWMLFQAHQILDWHLPLAYWGQDIKISGMIASQPHKTQEGVVSFLFDVRPERAPFANTDHHWVRIQLHWYHCYKTLKIGEPWQLLVRLKPLHRLASPGAKDFTKWAFYQHIRAKGYVRKSAFNHQWPKKKWLKKQQLPWYHTHPIDRLRGKIAEQLQQALGEQRPFLGIITALTLGFQSSITQAQWQVLRATGTGHLVAISGLHIGLIAGFFTVLAAYIFRRNAHLTHRIPASFPASILGLIAAFIYASLAGFSVSTQRALLMIFISVLLHCGYRQKPIWDVLALVMLIVLLIDPLSSLMPGFWLSFGAVALIFYSAQTVPQSHQRALLTAPRSQRYLKEWWRIQLFITLGLMPVSLFYFQQISLISLVANLVAIPYMSFIVIPLCLIGSLLLFTGLPSLGTYLLQSADHLIKPLWCFLEYLSSRPMAVWYHTLWDASLLLPLVAGSLIILATPLKRWRCLGIIGWLPLLVHPLAAPAVGDIWLSMLDVGQGLSVVVRTQHHVLVFDAGPRFGQGFDAGRAIILPFLSIAGLHQIDRLVISHGDNDHIGGAWSLLRNINIKQILSSVPGRFTHWPALACRAGQRWVWDGVTFEMMSPFPGLNQRSKNNRSCVLRVSHGQHSLLLTGDIEKPVERALVKRLGHRLASEILIAPHHGSRTSSSIPFIEAVNPQYVLFSTGFLNRFHFPNPHIIKRYKALPKNNDPIVLLNTAQNGTILFKLEMDSARPLIGFYSKEDEHYWDHQ